jgi:hypothetical protein
MKITLYVACGLASWALAGCAYKPLSAPYSMDEGGGPAKSAQVEAAPTWPGAPVEHTIQALSYAGAEPARTFGPFESVGAGDCGPLRPINSGTLR